MTLTQQIDVLQDIAIAQAENIIADIEVKEVLDRPVINTYNNTILDTMTLSIVQ